MSKATCYGCIHLSSESDAAGGGLFRCDRSPGLIVGEWGHWTDGDDEPRPVRDDCYEPGSTWKKIEKSARKQNGVGEEYELRMADLGWPGTAKYRLRSKTGQTIEGVVTY